MDKAKNISLISICADLVSGEARMKEFLTQLSRLGLILDASNIYKRQKNSKKKDFNSELWMVLKIETDLSAQELKNRLVGLSDPPSSKYICEGGLLTYNDMVWMRPGMTLPSPRLVEEGVILKCASEVWGIFEHPVLGETLNEITRRQSSAEGLEFFAQGKGLLL